MALDLLRDGNQGPRDKARGLFALVRRKALAGHVCKSTTSSAIDLWLSANWGLGQRTLLDQGPARAA